LSILLVTAPDFLVNVRLLGTTKTRILFQFFNNKTKNLLRVCVYFILLKIISIVGDKCCANIIDRYRHIVVGK